MRKCSLHVLKGAVETRLDGKPHGGVVDILQRLAGHRTLGVVDQDVEPAETFNRQGDGTVCVGARPHIAGTDRYLGAEGLKAGHHA